MYESTPIEAVVFARDRYRCTTCGVLGVPDGVATAHQADVERFAHDIESKAHALAMLVEAKNAETLLMALSIAARSDSELESVARMASDLHEARSVAPLPTIVIHERSPRVPGQRPGANLVTLCSECRTAELERRRLPAVSAKLVVVPPHLEAHGDSSWS